MKTLDTRADFVAVVHSLPEQDENVAQRSISHFHDLLDTESRIPVHEYKVSNLIQLRCAFVTISHQARRLGTPLVHIEMHADSLRGLKTRSGEFLGWIELSKLLSGINVNTKNTMMVVSCICFSLQVIFPPRMREPAPFALLVAPSAEVTNDTIETKISKFYTSLFRDNDTNKALQSVKPEMEIFFPERKLYDILRGVVWQYMGRAGRENRERVLTDILEDLPKDHGYSLASLRGIIKNYKDDFDEGNLMNLIGIFMCGRHPSFTAEDLKSPTRRV